MTRIWGATFAAVAWLAATMSPAAADDTSAAPVVRGLASSMTEARFRVGSRSGWTVGVPGTVTDTTVAVWSHAQGRVETLRLDEIETIEVLERSPGAQSRAWKGALMGAAAGALFATFAFRSADTVDCGPCFVVFVVVGVGGGAVAGGFTGLAIGSQGAERWVPVYGTARAP